MARSAAIQGRVAEAILDVAANLLAGGGEPPSMAEIAAAAGVGRATLYRHFPTREQLLQALSIAARDATATRLAEADLDAVPVTEAIARVARVVAAGGSKYAALISRFGILGAAGAAEQQIGTMIHALLQRGLDDGTFRGDLTVEELGFVLGQLLQAAARMTAERVAGVEKAAALITSVFLHGTERRHDTNADDPANLPTVTRPVSGLAPPFRSCPTVREAGSTDVQARVRSRCGSAGGVGSETALALGAGRGWRGSRAPAPPPRPR